MPQVPELAENPYLNSDANIMELFWEVRCWWNIDAFQECMRGCKYARRAYLPGSMVITMPSCKLTAKKELVNKQTS